MVARPITASMDANLPVTVSSLIGSAIVTLAGRGGATRLVATFHGAPPECRSAACVDLAPEGVDAGVPLGGHLLEGLVGLLFHELEAGAGDQVGDGAAELRARGHVEPAGEHERGRGDPA